MDRTRSVGVLLRQWRKRRRLSQLELSLRAQVSARHISFVETGRTTPSRSMVLHLATHLDVPLRERNTLLIAAGWAPTYQERPLDGREPSVPRKTIQRVLDGHLPYPALALDSRWNVLLSNAAVAIFLDGVDPALLRPRINMMRLGMHPRGFAPRLQNLPEIRDHLLPRLVRQAERTGDTELRDLYDELVAYGPPLEPVEPDPAAVTLTISIDHQGDRLRLFNTITTFGAAFDITLDDLAVEAYFPADEATAEILRARAA